MQPRSRSFDGYTILLATLCLTLVVASGCGDRATNQGGDGGPGSDLSLATTFAFVPDDDGSSPALFLRAAGPSEGTEIELEVVARGIAQLQGVAFRLLLSPQLEVSSTKAGTDFDEPAAIARFKRVGDELWAGIGRRGQNGVDAQSIERVVAKLRLRVRAAGNVPLAFRPHHQLVLESDKGQSVDARWFGGHFEPRP